MLEAGIAFLLSTLLFDIIHYFLHQSAKSKLPLLKQLASIHTPHHLFFTSNLKINHLWQKKNLKQHILLEYLIQIMGILLCSFFFSLPAIILAILFTTCISSYILFCGGLDKRHTQQDTIQPYRGSIFVDAAYHALHHIYPNKFFSSYIKLLDIILGTGHKLAGKKIVMTGASGALGSNMRRLLEQEGALVTTFKYGVDYTYDHYDKLKNDLVHTDILFLCHGAKYDQAQQANCDSFVKIIELYKKVHRNSILPPEIWAVGSEIECHPYFGIKKLRNYAISKRNFARYARQYYHDSAIQYRHLVHSAFTSQMGPGLITAKLAAKITLFFLKRGFKYIPVTYTGFALINYLRFLCQPISTRIINFNGSFSPINHRKNS